MSDEEDSGGQLSTTTISTVAIQAGDSRIVVAILKSGTCVHLQLAESTPNILEIGSSQDETKKLLQDHELLLAKLKGLENGVWDLLCEADETAEKNKDQSLVYNAMAKTLEMAWAVLVNLLEKRRALLNLAAEFYDRALEFAVKIDEAEDVLHHPQVPENIESLKEHLHHLSSLNKALLGNSLVALNKSQELINFIQGFRSEEPIMYPKITEGAQNSCIKIEGLLEVLQDRRRLLVKQLRQQQLDLEQILRIYQWDQQQEKVTDWFKQHGEVYLRKDQLGSSLSENEMLLLEYKEFLYKAKQWSSVVEKLKDEAQETSLAKDFTDKEHLAFQSQKLKMMYEEFWLLMEERQALLQEANDFFSSANKAFDELGSIEAHLKFLSSENLSLPVLAKEHEALQKRIKDAAAGALQKGQTLLSKAGSHRFQLRGIQEMIGYIQKRVDQLISQYHAHQELTVKKKQLLTSFEEQIEKISTWVQNCSPVLASIIDPGSCRSESEGILMKHLELSEQVKVADKEFKAVADIITELKECEASETVACVNRAGLLNEKLRTQSRKLRERLEILKVYVALFKSAEELEELMLILEEACKSAPAEEVTGGKAMSMSEETDLKWQAVLGKFLLVQDLAYSFTNAVNMMGENLNLNVEMATQVVGNILDKLTTKKIALSNVWTAWHLRVNRSKSVKKQWKKTKEQIKKILHNLKILENELMSVSKVDLGGDVQAVLDLVETFNQEKSQFRQLNTEVEYIIKISELLVIQGVPVKEKREKTSEILHVHQAVKDMIKQYESLFSTAVKFHHITQELESIRTTGTLKYPEPAAASPDADQAKVHLTHHQEQRTHIQHLYKLALTLGADLISKVQHSKTFSASKKHLQQKLDALEADSIKWSANADEYEDKLSANVHHCTVKEEINELKESFKELKKKFNNFKFNYMKKTEKARNLKAVKSQAQQVDMYYEKIQAFKKKMNLLETKKAAIMECQPEDKTSMVEEAMKELQNQVNEFDRSVEEYKQNLDLTVLLQQSMEECQFWCEETSATVLRVGKYSAECKSQEAVAMLYKQFEKFVCPTVPQQEDRIQQITDLAIRLHGAEEGKRFVEKMVTKHNEILGSVKELSNSLKKRELKLQTESVSPTQSTDMMALAPAMHSAMHVSSDVRTVATEKFSEKQEGSEGINQHSSRTQLNDQEASAVIGPSKKDTTETKDVQPLRENIAKQNWKSTVHQQFSSYTKSILQSAQVSELGRKIGALHHTKIKAKDVSLPSLSTPTDVTENNIISQIPVEEFRTEEPEEMFHTSEDTGHKMELQEAATEHKKEIDLLVKDSAEEDVFIEHKSDISPSAAEGCVTVEGDFQSETVAEEMSFDEYECASPDDISLPPLPETPESNILQSETELEERPCISSHSLHVSSCSPQTQMAASNNKQSNCSHLTPVAYADTFNTRDQCSVQAESYSSLTLGLGPKFRSESSSFVHSPLTVPAPSIISNTLLRILKVKPETESSENDTIYEVHETHLQHYAVHESVTEMQESLHEGNDITKTNDLHTNKLHASPDALTGFIPETGHNMSHSSQMADKEKITCAPENKDMHSLTGQAPSFSKLLSNVTVMEGSPVTLEVEISGFPEPTLTWCKNGQKLTSDKHLELSKKERKHILFIQKVCDKDAGLYVVRAKNSSGSLSSSAVLQVKVQEEAPNFEVKFTDATLLVGEDLILECTLSGKPKPQVIWMKDKMIVACSESGVQLLSDTHVLIKRNVVPADGGNYICIAKNEAGEVYCSAYIEVTEHNTNGGVCTTSEKRLAKKDCSSEGLKSSLSPVIEGTELDSCCMKGCSSKATQLSTSLS